MAISFGYYKAIVINNSWLRLIANLIYYSDSKDPFPFYYVNNDFLYNLTEDLIEMPSLAAPLAVAPNGRDLLSVNTETR